jgi:hypothetical protein
MPPPVGGGELTSGRKNICKKVVEKNRENISRKNNKLQHKLWENGKKIG